MKHLVVQRAEYAGACYGVQRALNMTYTTAENGGVVWTLGPLIHNPRVVKELQDQGITVAHSVSDITEGAAIIRSHGVVPSVFEQLEERNLQVIDATCPHVKRAQRAAADLAKQGYYVLVVGEEGHPEVEGILAHARAAGGQCSIVGTVADLPEDLPDKTGVVVQTTQSKELLESIVFALRAKGIDPQVKDTICFATTQRQDAAIDLARKVDTMVIIGGRNSSNTTRLYELCLAYCPHTYHIESAKEIDPSWFEVGARVGVSAGASTPENQIESVVSFLESL